MFSDSARPGDDIGDSVRFGQRRHGTEQESAHSSPDDAAIGPVSFPIRIDEASLCAEIPGQRLNSSIVEWNGGYLLAFRDSWDDGDIFVVPLDKRFRRCGTCRKLELMHSRAKYGREDPRFFRHQGKLHVAYVGVRGLSFGPIRWIASSQLYARLRDDLTVEQVYYPRYRERAWWEKSWAMFEHDGELYCVYSISPHRILRIRGDRAELAYETPTNACWKGGKLRGGASPVRVGNSWYHFFHGQSFPGKSNG